MLSQLQRLTVEADGRYASDAELSFLDEYKSSFDLRVQTYNKIHSLESKIVEQVYAKVKSIDPNLLVNGGIDISEKWKQDTFRVLRQSSISLLTNDTQKFKEDFLLWFQTIMQAFGTERSCQVTYTVMQEVIRRFLTPAEADLFCPVLELTRNVLGSAPRNPDLSPSRI